MRPCIRCANARVGEDGRTHHAHHAEHTTSTTPRKPYHAHHAHHASKGPRPCQALDQTSPPTGLWSCRALDRTSLLHARAWNDPHWRAYAFAWHHTRPHYASASAPPWHWIVLHHPRAPCALAWHCFTLRYAKASAIDQHLVALRCPRHACLVWKQHLGRRRIWP